MVDFAHYPSLKDRVVYITGGASGIGAEITRAFLGQGASVGIFDVDEQSAEALVSEFSDAIGSADAGQLAYEICDLRDIAALEAAFARMKSRIGAAQVLVNNAANDDRHDWADVTPDYFDDRISVNFKHMFFAIKAVASDMIEAGSGSIVNVGSNSWFEAVGGMPVYTSAKAAIHGLTRSFARDLGAHRIRVNAVVPGWVMTDRQRELWVTEEKLSAHLANQCLPDPIEPEYVANMVLFLGSDASAMCSAQNFFVEGGSV